jgi:predicted amidophosphoribosyltransferase
MRIFRSAAAAGPTRRSFSAPPAICAAGPAGTDPDGERLICEECNTIARPWEAGRAVMSYAEVGRKLVLGLKHGDRAEIARAAGPWMARAGAELLGTTRSSFRSRCIPLRLGAALQPVRAACAFAWRAVTGTEVEVRALVRNRDTDAGWQGPGRTVREPVGRHRPPPALRAHRIKGRPVVLIDDVMTSGATFAAAAEACRHAGASHVRVMALARVGNDT